MKKKVKITEMHRRSMAVFGVICAVFAALLIRIANIQTGSVSRAAYEQDTRRYELSESRGCIYDRNLIPLVNTAEEERLVLLCCNSTRSMAEKLFGKDSFLPGKVLVGENKRAEEENLCAVNVRIKKRYGEKLSCCHIIGYTDGDGNGVCGIEKAFDSLLKSASGKLCAEYTADAAGNAMPGEGIRIKSDNYDSAAGIALTVDSRIQDITEKAIADSGISSGAALVMDCNTFEILAAVSVPSFDVNNIAAALSDDNSPFVNRCFSAYPVGSVFKPFVAAAAMMNGDDLSGNYRCRGSIEAGRQTFRCFNGKAHGRESLFEAVSNSCNCYFVNAGLKLGKEKLLDAADRFGFGQSTELFPGETASAGNLPEQETVVSDAQLANLCFGQGELLATPLQMAAAYSVIANGGEYREPYILYRLIDGDKKAYGYYKSEIQRTVLSREICDSLGNSLYNNMLTGTGKNGRPSLTTAAGKTATAQTGRYQDNGKEQLCTWFAGYFPFDKPEYTVVIFNENGSSASVDCAPVFREIADEIME